MRSPANTSTVPDRATTSRSTCSRIVFPPLGIDRPNSPSRRGLGHLGNLVFFPTGVPTAKIAFAREGGKVTQLTLADPNVMLTARRV